jgi:ferredoxin
MHVWIDQDLCTGDGLCTDHCPEAFVILEDGISYVRDEHGVHHDPGGPSDLAVLAPGSVDRAIAAALDCPGECIFIEQT